MALRVAQSNAPEIGRSPAASPDRFTLSDVLSVGATIAALAATAITPGAFEGGATSVLCLALLVFGLPHGSLDIAVLRRKLGMGPPRVIATLALYLACAAAMLAVWLLAPVAALGSFLIIAAAHFAEDWKDDLPPFFAVGTAVALLASPALGHSYDTVAIFVALTGQADAAVIVDLMLIVAPVALIAAAMGLALAIANGHGRRASETGATIVAMMALPPIAGFAIYFCLSHSPRHFRHARRAVGEDSHRFRYDVVFLTLAALGFAVVLYPAGGTAPMADKAIFASFVTLSVLTVPHMIVPRIVNWRH